MSSCDVVLLVRGVISSRHGSAIAGISCGLRVSAFDGYGTASAITEAGVVFGDPKRQRGSGEALPKVLSNERYRASHAACGRGAQEKYFS